MLLKRKSDCAPVRNCSLARMLASSHVRPRQGPGWAISASNVSSARGKESRTHKLSVINPSRSVSYRLNTSVILFKLIHACTNRSKLNTPRPFRSYASNSCRTYAGVRRYPKAVKAEVNSSREMVPELSTSKRSKRVRQEERKDQRALWWAG